MQTNLFTERILVVEKVTTQTATGKTVTKKPAGYRYGRKIPVDAKARLEYQQLKTEITHKLVFEGNVTLELATHEFQHGGHNYTPVGPAFYPINQTVIMVKES